MVDNLTPLARSHCMSRVKGRDTTPERVLRSAVFRAGLRFRKHYRLPGTPDMVFVKRRIAVFIDGDFWHGYRYTAWTKPLSAYWRAKIERNRARDRRNVAALRRDGWIVLRIWEHDIFKDLDGCVSRIIAAWTAAPAERPLT